MSWALPYEIRVWIDKVLRNVKTHFSEMQQILFITPRPRDEEVKVTVALIVNTRNHKEIIFVKMILQNAVAEWIGEGTLPKNLLKHLDDNRLSVRLCS